MAMFTAALSSVDLAATVAAVQQHCASPAASLLQLLQQEAVAVTLLAALLLALHLYINR
jgi:hypothetical protein